MTEASEVGTRMAHGSIVPTLRYRDAAAAIEWLCDAFGFERQLVYPGDAGTIAHAQLTLNGGMIMLGSASNEGEFGRWVQPPTAGIVSQGLYVIVADADAHHARAVARGAEVLLPLVDQDYGGRDYTCRDLEGYVWTFGTYDPWNVPAEG